MPCNDWFVVWFLLEVLKLIHYQRMHVWNFEQLSIWLRKLHICYQLLDVLACHRQLNSEMILSYAVG